MTNDEPPGSPPGPLAAAHDYVRRGWGVVPLYGVTPDGCRCKAGRTCPPKNQGKHPHGNKAGWRIFRSGPDVQAWWDENPHDNLGISTGPESGIFVVDVDGPTGMQSLLVLIGQHGELPPTRTVRTGSDGRHIFFRYPDGATILNSTSALAPGIDIRGDGGQVVAPPSVSGRGPYGTIADDPVAEAPAWLLAWLADHATRAHVPARAGVVAGEPFDQRNLSPRVRELVSEIIGRDEGRHRHFYAIVAACFEAGYTQGQTVTIVTPWCDAVQKFAGRVEAEVARAWGKVEESAARMAEWAPEGSVERSAPTPTVTALEEDTFWDARPHLRHLRDFARARRVSPWAVLGVTLARVITATPFCVAIPPIVGGKASLNIFVGLVGPSGSGKGAAEAVAADAIHLPSFTSHNVGSGEGIAHGYKVRVKGGLEWIDEQHAVLFSVPEIDSLAAQGDRRGATLMPQLRSGWTGEQLGFGYADPTKRIIVEAHMYRLCLVAGIQPGRAACLIDDADGGTPQRFLWMPATDPDAPDDPVPAPAPITWEPPALGRSVWDEVDRDAAGWTLIGVCDLARTTIVANRLARLRGDGDALDGHALLAQLKTAAALAILDGRLVVTDDDWHLADVIARKSADTRGGVVAYLKRASAEANEGRAVAEAGRAAYVAESLTDAAVRRVCKTITRKLGAGDWETHSNLRRSLSSPDRQHFDAALDRLGEAGQIEHDGAGRGIRYRLIRGAS